MKYFVIVLLIIFFIYMVVWSLKLYSHTNRQKKVRRIQELRAKGNEVVKADPDDKRDYWYNVREVESCPEEERARYYHYFEDVSTATSELLLEMYDCGVIRTDELNQIAYGKNRFKNMDLSFLEELEREILSDEPATLEKADDMVKKQSETEASQVEGVKADVPQAQQIQTEGAKTEENGDNDSVNRAGLSDVAVLDDVIQVEGVTDSFFTKKQPDVIAAAKELKKDDPGITDIHGTLSDGVKNVIAAVDAEKKVEEEKNEPILKKEEKSVEDARKAREMTSNAEIRNKVYEKWLGYVEELFELVHIHTSDETKQKIRKNLTEYGYNDVDVLLESPE